MLDDARSSSVQEARRDSILCRKYYDGDQLSGTIGGKSIKAILAARGMPEIAFNRVKAAVNGTLGVVGKSKTDPRAYMRNPPTERPAQPASLPPMGHNGGPPMAPPKPQDKDAGDVASMTLRYIADTVHFKTVKTDVLENILIEGCGAVIIEIDEGKDVTCEQIRWEEFFFDPRSRKADFSDARYMGVAKYWYADDLAAKYPDKAKIVNDTMSAEDASSASADNSFEDRPLDQSAWVDKRLRRLMLVELYYKRGGTWYDCRFCSGGILDEAVPVAYKDRKGRTVCPIVAQSGYIDIKNGRYGMVRDMRGVQDEINMRRLKALHEMNSRQIQQDDPNAPPTDADEARGEAARPDGVLPPGWKIVPRNDVVANNIEMLQLSNSEIERMGPNPAILGRQGADASGRSAQIRQEAGLTELWPLLGRFTNFENRCYDRMWGCAAQFWDGPRWIRVTDDEGAPDYVQINEPAPTNPMTGQPLGKPKHHIAQMDVDIVVDSVPDTATLQQEVFNELMQLVPAYQGTPQMPSLKTIIRMSPLPKRLEVIKQLEMDEAAAAQAAAPAMQLDQAGKVADVQKTQADTKLTEVKTVTEAMRGHMEAAAASVMPPGVEQVANLPQNQPQAAGAGAPA